MLIRFTPSRVLLAAGMALAGFGDTASAQYQNYPQQPQAPVYRPQVTPPAYAQGYRPNVQQVAAPDPIVAIPGPAPVMVQGQGCASGNCGGGYASLTGDCTSCNSSNGNPANFAPNKKHCKDGCQPYCATKTYPHSDWHYIKKYCGPSLIPDGCNNAYGHFSPTWRKWEDIAPGWQPNNDANCNKGCATGNCGTAYPYPHPYAEGQGEYYLPGTVYPQGQPLPGTNYPQSQPLPNPMPAPNPNPMQVPVPMPMPMPAPVPMPMPMTLPPTTPTVPPVTVPPTTIPPAPIPPGSSQVTIPQVATPVVFQMPLIEKTASAIRVEQGHLLNDPLALPAVVKSLPWTTDIVLPPVTDPYPVRN